MTDDELERLLSDAFEARGRSAVPDHAPEPAPRFAYGKTSGPRRGRGHVGRVLAPLLAAAAVVAVVLGVVAVSGGSDERRDDAARQSPAGTSTAARPASSAVDTPASPDPGSRHVVAAPPSATPVHLELANAADATVGVGMPVIAYLSRTITDGRSLAAATTVSVNGSQRPAGWYFEHSNARRGFPIEAHLRLQDYWPAHSKVIVSVASKGLSAGPGFGFANSLALHFTTGPRLIATVDETSHRMTVMKDGAKAAVYPVSLGARSSPTASGIKVIMDKGREIAMHGPGYYDPSVKFTQRLTYDGEYLHSAPWNITNIKKGIDTSNGCTNMLPADAKRFYAQTNIGDVVAFPDATGRRMAIGQGYGDWNVPWSTWQRGGLVRTS